MEREICSTWKRLELLLGQNGQMRHCGKSYYHKGSELRARNIWAEEFYGGEGQTWGSFDLVLMKRLGLKEKETTTDPSGNYLPWTLWEGSKQNFPKKGTGSARAICIHQEKEAIKQALTLYSCNKRSQDWTQGQLKNSAFKCQEFVLWEVISMEKRETLKECEGSILSDKRVIKCNLIKCSYQLGIKHPEDIV